VSTSFGRPADEAITAAQMTRRGRPGQASDRSIPCRDHILQVFADRSRVAQVVVLLDQAVKQRFLAGPSHLVQLQRSQSSQAVAQRSTLDLDSDWPGPLNQWIARSGPGRWQLNVPGPVQVEHQPSAYHVARLTIGLHPVPSFAEFLRQGPTT
jgi:hypothetical protein